MENEARAITRRDFVKGSAAVGGLSVVSSRSAFGTQANSAVTVGLIGCGGRGTHDVSKFKDNANARVVALADVFEDRLKSASDRFADDSPKTFEGMQAYEELLESDVDVVFIVSPPYFHPEQFEAAVDAEKHIYLEKPVAVDTAGALKVKAAGVKAADNQTIFVGFQSRSREDLVQGVKRVHNGAIGPVTCGKAYYNSGWLSPRHQRGEKPDEARLRNWVFDIVLSGCILVEQNIHVIDICNWAVGSHPFKAYGTGGRRHRTEVGDTWDHYEILFTYPNDAVISFTSTQFLDLGWDNAGEAFYGPKGDMEVFGWMPEAKRVRIRGQEPWEFETTPADFEASKMQQFYESITSGTGINQTAQGVEATLSAILGRTAAFRGREYTWAEMLREGESWSANLSIEPNRM
ncbi:MAG: Gfo/Idh/MocA family oxidoreductase [Acidobacteriota bacterium]|nr:MAG: Gfo/Idh/MocA family oxidoreductase [Acidobacteriota bacterium]